MRGENSLITDRWHYSFMKMYRRKSLMHIDLGSVLSRIQIPILLSCKLLI
jgi:hypothetical protein